jgi:hypothetical protein
MSFALHPRRLVVAAVAVAGVALFAEAAHSHPGRTYTITALKTRGSVWTAGGGKAMSVGRLNRGDRLLQTHDVRRGDGVKGVFAGTMLGMMPAVYRFGDGDIYVVGFVTFARPFATGVIVGGTGAFRGAHGTFASTEAMDVLSLQP